MTKTPTHPGSPVRSWLFGTQTRPHASPERLDELAQVRLEMIAREHAGKTALKTCLYKGPLAGPQPSGLELAATDPKSMTRWMIDSLESYRDLASRGLLSTLDPVAVPFHLYFADELRAAVQLREVVGQVLTHTTPDSDDEQQRRYAEYVDHLGRADVLQVLVGCPASDAAGDLARFEADLMVTAGYLREALKSRPTAAPVAVQLLMGKVDVPFANPAAARAALTDDRLTAMLGRLVRIVEGSAKVGMGAVFPVSAFGFETAVRAADPAAQPSGYPAGGYSLVSDGEAEYLLKPGAAPQPFNLTAAVWWAVMAGLLLKPADRGGNKLADTARLMADDLQAMDAWFVPLKAGGSR